MALIYAIAKYANPETRIATWNINRKIEMANMTPFKKNVEDSNHQLSEWTEEIAQAGDTYNKNVCYQFNLYGICSWK